MWLLTASSQEIRLASFVPSHSSIVAAVGLIIEPEGMTDGVNLLTYQDAEHAVEIIKRVVESQDERQTMANRAYSAVRNHYSKDEQWRAFQKLVAEV